MPDMYYQHSFDLLERHKDLEFDIVQEYKNRRLAFKPAAIPLWRPVDGVIFNTIVLENSGYLEPSLSIRAVDAPFRKQKDETPRPLSMPDTLKQCYC
jgi:hypothetical protein